MREDTLPLDHFERLYAARQDPWHLTTSAYEQAKYAATRAALPRPRYGRALEIGCALGVQTVALASRCDRLVAVEPVQAALDAARERVRAAGFEVDFEAMFVPADWPRGRFDLILLGDVLDYLGPADLDRLAERILASLDPGGHLIAVHWVGKKSGPPSGREATDRLIGHLASAVQVLRQERNSQYRLDLLERLA